MIKKVFEDVANSSHTVFAINLAKLNGVGQTESASIIKSRLNLFKKNLGEVRYHKMFELKEAIKGLVAVIQPEGYLVHEVLAIWSASSKDQKALSVILTHAAKETNVTRAGPTDGNGSGSQGGPSNHSQHHKGSGSRNSQGHRNTNKPQYGKNNGSQSSGNYRNKGDSGSTAAAGARRVCRNFEREGACSYGDSCLFQHQKDGQPAIHQVVANQFNRQFKKLTLQHEQQKEQMRAELMAEIRETMHQEQQQSINELHLMMQANAAGVSDGSDDDNTEGDLNPWILVTHKKRRVVNPRQVKVKTPSTAVREARASKQAKLRSVCVMPQGPVIDSATDIDVCCPADAKYAVRLFPFDQPMSYSTVVGSGSTKQTASLSTPLVEILEAPIIPGARTSLVSHACYNTRRRI
jgi:hypothetical protein